jgi:hypothetical protein
LVRKRVLREATSSVSLTSLDWGVLVESDADAHPSVEVLPVWWQDRAACVGVDPEVFFPLAGHDATEARAVCMACPVLSQCRDYADALEEGLGAPTCSGSSLESRAPSDGGEGEVWASPTYRSSRKLPQHFTGRPVFVRVKVRVRPIPG